MPFVLNGSPLIFSPCFVFLLFFFFVAIADLSQCERFIRVVFSLF